MKKLKLGLEFLNEQQPVTMMHHASKTQQQRAAITAKNTDASTDESSYPDTGEQQLYHANISA